MSAFDVILQQCEMQAEKLCFIEMDDKYTDEIDIFNNYFVQLKQIIEHDKLCELEKKVVWMTIALSGVGIPVHAQTSVKDSMKVVNLQEVQVVSTRATAKTPVAFTNIGKAELKKVNFGQDIPYLLSMTPSTLTSKYRMGPLATRSSVVECLPDISS